MEQTIKIRIEFFYNDYNTSFAEVDVNTTCNLKKAAKQWCQEHHCEFVDFKIV